MMHDLISADRCHFMKSDPSRSSVIFIEPPRDMKVVRRKEEKEEKKGKRRERGFVPASAKGVRPRSSSGRFFIHCICSIYSCKGPIGFTFNLY